jgi:hypothetical protein
MNYKDTEPYMSVADPDPNLDPDPPDPHVFGLFLGGGGSCVIVHIQQEFNTQFLTRFRTYKIATPLQTKMTSKDDI